MMNHCKEEIKESEEFFDGIIKQYEVMCSGWTKYSNKHLNIALIPKKEKIYFLKKILPQMFKKFENDGESLHVIFKEMIYCSFCRVDECEKYEDIFGQLLGYVNEKLNQEVRGAEKLIATMLLLGYRDLHGANLGIIRTEQEDVEGNKIVESVYAKVDMSASFYNLSHTSSMNYMYDLKKMLIVKFIPPFCDFYEEYYVKHNIDYIKLKEEINKACDLFIENPAYITSLVHRALLYKKPLLKTKELNLVEGFIDQLKIQAKLLKKFANSAEFEELKGFIPKECYLGCDGYEFYSNPIIEELAGAVKANLIERTVSTQETLNIQDLESNSNVQKSNPNDATSQNEKRSKLPAAVASILAIAGVVSILAMEIAIGVCCLVSAAIIYYCNRPSNSLEKSSAEAAGNRCIGKEVNILS